MFSPATRETHSTRVAEGDPYEIVELGKGATALRSRLSFDHSCCSVLLVDLLCPDLGTQPATGQAVQGQTAAQPEGTVLNLVNWVGNVIAPVGAALAVVMAVVAYSQGRGVARWAVTAGVSGIGQLGKTYAINVMIWNAWGILYAVFGALITAIHFNQVNDVLGNGFLGFLKGVPDSLMLGLVSVFYALAIALVPFIAKRIISGDVGSTALTLVRAGAVAAGAALAGVSGFSAGAGTGAGGSSSSGVAGASAGGTSSSGTFASSMPPPAPASSMAGFLRSGMTSAMNSSTSPVAPSPSTNGAGNSGNGSRSTAAAAGTGFGYRPHSVTQVLTYNVARALGKAAGRNNAEDN